MIGGLRFGTGAVKLKKAEGCGHLRSGLAVWSLAAGQVLTEEAVMSAGKGQAVHTSVCK